jgi:hypothetical protein
MMFLEEEREQLFRWKARLRGNIFLKIILPFLKIILPYLFKNEYAGRNVWNSYNPFPQADSFKKEISRIGITLKQIEAHNAHVKSEIAVVRRSLPCSRLSLPTGMRGFWVTSLLATMSPI